MKQFVMSAVMIASGMFSQSAFADLRCTSPQDVNSPLVCLGAGVKRVSYRRIPSWNEQADLLVIDLCELRERSLEAVETAVSARAVGTGEGEYLALDEAGMNKMLLLPANQCVRKYCSQNVDKLAIRLEGVVPAVVLPMGSVTGSVVAGFTHANFEVRCADVQ